MKFTKKVNDLQGKMLGFKHRMTERIRRMCAVALSASLVVSGFPSIPVLALAAEDETADYTFDLTTEDLSEAIATALSEGTTVDKELDFRGEFADEYDELFDPDGTLYELKSLEYEKDEERDKDLQLRVFARITGDIPLDMDIDDMEDSEDDEDSDAETESFYEYVPDGSEPLIFLLIDRSKDEVNTVVRVDDAETEVITVYPASEIPEEGSTTSLKSAETAEGETEAAEAEIEISISDEEDEEFGDEITDDSDVSVDDRSLRGGKKSGTGGGGGGASSGRGGNSRKDSSSEEDSNSDEKDSSSDENDSDSSEGSSSDNDSSDTGNDSSSEKTDNNSERSNNSSEKSDSSSEKADSSDSSSGSADSSSGSSSGSNDSDNSSSGSASDNDSGSSGSNNNRSNRDNNNSSNNNGRNGRSDRSSGSSSGSGSSESSGDKVASISIHETNLLAAAIASSSNARKASASDASPSDASPSDATKAINGTVYEPVLLGRRGAVAFETNLQEVGLGYGISLLSSDDPVFTVQFWANLDTIYREHHDGDTDLTVIETHTDNGAVLPKNEGSTSASAYNTSVIEMTPDGKIDSENVLTQMYADEEYEFVEESTVHYMNKVEKNSDYKLVQIWKLKEGKEATSIVKDDWDVYNVSRIDDTENYTMEFTNNATTAEAEPDKYILVEDDDVFRFVYDTTSANAYLDANFYDYNIGNGTTYSSASTSGGTWNGSGTAYLYTAEQGINNASNYSGSGTKLAFGNDNTGTGLGQLTWSKDGLNNLPNKYNSGNGLLGCTFGIAESLDTSTNTIKFSYGINAPNLFGGSAIGKETFQNVQLEFSRKGDTYTLAAVSGSNGVGVNNLDSFNTTAEETSAYTNNFWPMDNVSYDGMDVKFGSSEQNSNSTRQYFGNSTGRLPLSDDHEEHNSYFGMNFDIYFEYTKDYVGPLEYFFFGDDDMWVFLDDQLVIDIGGVHSTVGEHVNLWDYLKNDTFNEDGIASHTLSVFYTERGASGSTCFIQYTLPEVSSVTPVDDASNLIIEKEVVGVETEEDFTFTITLKDVNGTEITNQYSCIFSRNGVFTESDPITSGDTFYLKDGESVEIRNLPNGTIATVEEKNGTAFTTTYEVGTVDTDGNETVTNTNEGKTANGTVSDEGTTYIKFINTIAPSEKSVDSDNDDSYDDNGAQAAVGTTLTYKIDFTNYHDPGYNDEGDSTDGSATVTITDVLDKGLDYKDNVSVVFLDENGNVDSTQSATYTADYDQNSRTLTCVIQNVPSQTSGYMTFQAEINEDALEINEVDNTAKVQVGDDPEVETEPVYTPVPGKDVDVSEDGEEEPSYGDNGVGVKVGDTLTYKIEYRNLYEEAATVTITDVLDDGLDFVEASDGGTYDEDTRTITWTLTNVGPNPAEDEDAYYVTFTATVNGKAHVSKVVNNQAVVDVDNHSAYTNEVENPLTHKDVDVDPDDGHEYGDSGVQVQVGDTLTYIIEYQNMHDEAAIVTITDVLDEGLDFVSAENGGTYDKETRTITWVIENVPAHTTNGSVTFKATVNETALVKNEVDNTASVQVGDDPAIDTNIVWNPVPGKDVDADGDGSYGDTGVGVQVGDTLIYEITYRNDNESVYDENGTEISDGIATVTITDVLDNGLTYVSSNPEATISTSTGGQTVLTWTIENVASHTKGSVKFTATVNENALVENVVENTATVQVGNNPDVAVDTNTVYNPIPDKNVDANGDGDYDDSGMQVQVGDTLVYKIDYENPDDERATVTITDVLDVGLDFVEADNDGKYDEETRTITWVIEDVEAHAKGSVTFTATVNEEALVLNVVENTATVQVGDHSSMDTKTVYNPVPGKDVDVPEEGEEEPSFGDDGDSVQVGDTLTYEVTFRNDYDPEYDEVTGELIPVTFTITDEIDPGLDYVDGFATCIVTPDDGSETITADVTYDEETRTLTCVIDNMPAHSKGVLTFQATVNENALEKEAVDNDATVRVKVGNESEVETKTNPVHNPIPNKNVDANDDGEFDDSGMQVQIGDTLVYKIDYENPDDASATVTITDVLDEGLDFVSATDGGVYDKETRTITWTIENVNANTKGSVTFTAIVNEKALIKNYVDNTAAVQVGEHAEQQTKTVYNPVPGKDVDAPETGEDTFGDSGEDVRVGETLTYKISFFNGYASPSDATVTITDTLDAGLDYKEGSPKVYLIDEDGDPVELTEGSDYTVDYDEDTRKLVVVIDAVPALTGGYLTFEAVVNSTALKEDEVRNTALVQVGDDPDVAVETNEVDNPVPDKDVDVDGPDENGEYSYGDNGIGVHVGDTLTYRIHYFNGHATPSDAEAEASTTVIITDTLDEGLDYVKDSASNGGVYDEETRTITWTLEDVPSDTGGYVTFQAIVNEKALVKNEVENTAKVQVNGDPSVKTNTVYNPVPHKDVDINPNDGLDYGDDGLQVQVGDTLTYKIDYQNPYDEPATITITDELDPGLTFVSASDDGAYDEDTRTITWVIEGVAPHSEEGYYVTFTATVNDDAYIKYEVDNIAYVHVNDDPFVYTEWVYNPVPHKGVDTDNDGEYDDDGEDVYVDDTLTYKVDFYAYASSSDAVKVTITDVLDKGLDYVDGSPEVYLYIDGADKDPIKITSGVTVEYNDRTLTVTIEDVPSNTQGYMTFQATVNSDALTKKIVNNKASVQIGDDPAVETNEVENHVREYYPIDERIVVDDSDENLRFNLDNWVEKESVNEYNGIEIEMTTILPIIELDDFLDGDFTLNFHEVLDSHLVIDENNSDFVLYLRGDTDNPIEIPEYDVNGVQLYRVTIDPDETCYIPDNDGGEPTETHCTFHVWVDLNALYDAGYIDETDLQGNTWITIFFYADLEDEGLNGSYGSTVWYDVKEGEDVVYTSNSAYVYVYTYDIVINKVSSTTGRSLSGAEFEIYYDEACENPVYRNVGGRFSDSERSVYTVTSGSDGKAIFYGLAEGTYYIKELKAPSGYVATDTVTEVTVSGTGSTNITITITNRPTGGGGGSSGGGGGSSGGGGGSGSGGPGSGGSEGEGDSWNLLPIPQTGQGWAMLIGTCALVISAMALIVLLWRRKRSDTN